MTEQPVPEHVSPPRVLIIDDDPLIRLLAAERLGSASFDVHEAANGSQGLEAFSEITPDLVLLDVEMPDFDGFDVCRALRETAAGEHVPVLILTGRGDVQAIDQAYAAGATDFVTKPINWLILTHRIRYILRASEHYLELRAQRARLAYVQRYARLGSWEFDLRTGHLSACNTLQALLEMKIGEGTPASRVLDQVHPEDRSALEQACVEAIHSSGGFSLEHRLLACDGSERIVHTQAQMRAGVRGEAAVLEGFTQDITDRRHTEDQVRLLAFSDSLTGLANRAAFKLQLANAIHRARRSSRPLGILYLDLDQFKRVNDTFGHTAGDNLLKMVATSITECVRDSDVVSRSAGSERVLISRLGGDEFTILLEGLADPSDAGIVAERVLESLSHPLCVDGHEIRTTASVGISIWPDDGPDGETLLRNADSAMYQAKKLGRANFQFYRRAFNSRALERLELESSLSRAIEQEQLYVHYQPKLRLGSGRISGCEALARWRDPTRGLVAPAAFVPLAESSGLIANLGEMILRRACLGGRLLQRRTDPEFELAVNLSPGQIHDVRLLDMVDGILDETGFEPRLLDFEITETALIHDEDRAAAVLEGLRERGCRISLDDFGTGYSSLSSLKRYRVQTVKIDCSFVAGIGRCKEDEAITKGILALARDLGMRSVGEGVETREQLDFLRSHGCDEVQGFLISRPIGLEELEAFLDGGARAGSPSTRNKPTPR